MTTVSLRLLLDILDDVSSSLALAGLDTGTCARANLAGHKALDLLDLALHLVDEVMLL